MQHFHGCLSQGSIFLVSGRNDFQLRTHAPLSPTSQDENFPVSFIFLRIQRTFPPLFLQNRSCHHFQGTARVTSSKRVDGSRKDSQQAHHVNAVRALPMRLVSVGKSRSPGTQLLTGHYTAKIRRYCAFEDMQVRSNPKNSSNPDIQVAAEGERVLRSISPGDFLLVLDERGRTVTSEQLAVIFASAGESSASSLIICIGGPYGHSNAVRERANAMVCLSSMVLNHEVALIVALEQVYRAWTILRGEKYHH